MKFEDLLKELNSEDGVNNALGILQAVVVDKDDRLLSSLRSLIDRPELIGDTNKFASLLVDLESESFVEALIKAVSQATPGESVWLSDYMYALGMLLTESEEEFSFELSFINKLGEWLLQTGGGEIAWKAGDILGHSSSPSALPFILAGARDTELFHQTRISCMGGVVNNFRPEARALLEELENDSCQYVSAAARDAKKWMDAQQALAADAAARCR